MCVRESEMDKDSRALRPGSIPLATNDFCCRTTTNGLCPPLLSYLPPLSFSLLRVLSISDYSIPCYLATSALCLYLIFITLCLYLPLSFFFFFNVVLSPLPQFSSHQGQKKPKKSTKVQSLFSFRLIFSAVHGSKNGGKK